jgi:hypothetical protein
MALLAVRTDVAQAISQLDKRVQLLTDRNVAYMAARAMTRSAQAAQTDLKQAMPRFIRGGPTPFTQNSTYVRFAKPTDLSVEVGFKQFASKGTPAGRYLQPMAGGGGRRNKSSELQLQRKGLLRVGEYIVPADVTPLRLNSYGNLTGGTYTQLLSRLGGFGEQGYTANVSRAAASQAKRRQRDYFLGQPGGLPRGIQARVGPRPKGNPGGIGRPVTSNLPRGFHTVFYITGQPRYKATFPIRDLLSQGFERSWRVELQAAFAAELAGKTGIRL